VQTVSTLGLGQAAIIEQTVSASEVSALFWLGLALNLAVCAVVIVLSPLVGLAYRTPEVVPVAIALAVLVPLAGLATQPAALLNRDLRFQSLALADVLPPAANLCVAYACALRGLAYWSLVWGAAAESVVGAGLVWLLARFSPGWPKFDARARALIRSGGRLTGYNLAVYATTSVDNVLLGLTRGAATLGLYDKAYKLVTQPLSQITSAADRIALPTLVRLAPNPEPYRRMFLRMLEISVGALTPGVVAVMLDAEPLTRLALGVRWVAMAPAASWLALGAMASTTHSAMSWLFKSQGRTAEQLKVGVVVSVVSVASFVAGLPWGAAGVAAGAGVSFLFVSTPYACWRATREGPVGPRDLVRTLWPLAAGAGASAAAIGLRHAALVLAGWIGVAGDLLISHLAFLVALAASRGGRDLLGSLWRSRLLLAASGR
jgi:polysaccharide transporter, PST family